jgi:hypothetical protein
MATAESGLRLIASSASWAVSIALSLRAAELLVGDAANRGGQVLDFFADGLDLRNQVSSIAGGSAPVGARPQVGISK